jgi:hypothetical protein
MMVAAVNIWTATEDVTDHTSMPVRVRNARSNHNNNNGNKQLTFPP